MQYPIRRYDNKTQLSLLAVAYDLSGCWHFTKCLQVCKYKGVP